MLPDANKGPGYAPHLASSSFSGTRLASAWRRRYMLRAVARDLLSSSFLDISGAAISLRTELQEALRTWPTPPNLCLPILIGNLPAFTITQEPTCTHKIIV